MVQAKKKIALLHRHSEDRIKETNAAFPYLKPRLDVLTLPGYDRAKGRKKLAMALLWLFKAPLLVAFKGYKVIYCDDSMPFYPILVKLVSPRSKVVLRIGDFHLMYYTKGWVYSVLHWFEKIGWMMADKILVISEAMQEKLAEEGFRSYVVNDPVETKDFKPDTKHKPMYRVVMFHGQLTANKDLHQIIFAACVLPDIYFWIVGDGPELPKLRAIAPKNVVFTGWHDYKHMNSLIQDCAIGLALRGKNPGNEYVVTSPYLQYGAAGKPCLVTRRKVFGNYKWQFDTVGELVTKIEDLLERPEEGKKLRGHILKHHSAEKIAEQIWSHLSS